MTSGDLSIACLPLPPTLSAGSTASLIDHVSGEEQNIQVKASLAGAVEKLGLAHAVGCIQFLQVKFSAKLSALHKSSLSMTVTDCM